MRAPLLIGLLVLALAGPARAQDEAAPVEQPRTLLVGVGQMKTLTFPRARRVSVGDPAVLDLQALDGGQFVLVGRSPGQTTLLVWLSETGYVDYSVAVRQDAGVSEGTVGEIRKLLGDMEGVRVRLVGERIYLDGSTYTRADAERLAQVAACFPGVVDLTRPAPASRQAVARQMNDALTRAGLSQARAVAVGDTYFLEGSVESEEDRAKAERIVRAVLESGAR